MSDTTERVKFRCDECGKLTPMLLAGRYGDLTGAVQNKGEVCWPCFIAWCNDYHVLVPSFFPRLCNDPDHV